MTSASAGKGVFTPWNKCLMQQFQWEYLSDRGYDIVESSDWFVSVRSATGTKPEVLLAIDDVIHNQKAQSLTFDESLWALIKSEICERDAPPILSNQNPAIKTVKKPEKSEASA